MGELELSATAFGLACVILTVRRSVWAWPVGMVGIGLYAWLFWHAKLYADVVLQGFYTVQFLYGWHQWREKRTVEADLEVRRMKTPVLAAWLLGSVLLGLLWGWALARLTDAALPYPDAVGAILSLSANALLALRYRENWLVWIVADALLLGVYAQKELWPTVGLYTIYLGMAVWGWQDWAKADKRPSAG